MTQDLRRPDLVHRPEPISAPEVVQAATTAALAATGRPERGSPVVPWGAPMDAPPAPVRRPHHRPDTESGWGRGTNDLLPDGRTQEMARVELEVSEPLTLSIDVDVPPGLDKSNNTPLTVWAKVVYGNGSTNAARFVRCDYRADVPVVAGFAQVIIFVGETEFAVGETPAPYVASDLALQSPATVEVQVARGIRGLPYVASQFITANNSIEGTLIDTAARVLSVEAHLTAIAGGTRYLQLYDTNKPDATGLTPVAEYPLGVNPYPGLLLTRFINPRAFSQGVHYVVSTTSGSYTPGTDEVHIEIEQLLI